MTITDVPPVVLEDTDILPILNDILGCLCTALEQSPGGKPCYCGLLPGDTVAMDYCDCTSATNGCGMAWARLDMSLVGANVYNSVYARKALNTARCVAMMSHRVQLGVTRCLTGMDVHGAPPREWQNYEAARIQLGDFAAMRRALDCCFPLDPRREWLFERYIPYGPAGNCVGGYCTFTYRTLN